MRFFFQYIRTSYRAFSLKKVSKKIEAGVSIIVKLGTLLLIILFLAFFIQIFQKQGYVLQAFSVPDAMEKQGWSGTIVARKVQDEVLEIKKVAHSVKVDSLQLLGNDDPEINLSIIGVGLSLNSIVYHLREMLGQKNQLIQGEITQVDQQLLLTMRMTKHEPLHYIEQIENGKKYEAMQRLFRHAGEAILSNTDPYRLAIFCYKEKRYDEAIELTRRIIKERPEEVHWAYLAWGNILQKKGKYIAAAKKFRRATEIKPDFDLAFNGLAWSLNRLEQEGEAEQMMRKALKINPHNSDRWMSFAWMLFQQQKYEAADSIFEKASILFPNKPEIWMAWTDSKLSTNDMKSALPIVQKAEAFAEENCYGYLIRAFSSLIKGDTLNAVEYAYTAFEFNPAHPPAIMSSMRASSLVEDYDKAIYTCENADFSKANNWQKQTIFNMGAMAYNIKGKHDLAFQMVQDAIVLDTTTAYPYSTLAETYAFQGNNDLFYKYLGKALNLGMSIRFLDFDEAPYRRFKNEPKFIALIEKYGGLKG